MQTERRVPGFVIAVVMTLGALPFAPAAAQMDSDVADVVAASTVLLSALVTKTEDGREELYRECFLGGGAVVGDDARTILTTGEVAGLADLVESAAGVEAATLRAENPGSDVDIRVSELAVWVVDHTEALSDRRYRADVVAVDAGADLAVLRISGDSQGREHDRPLFRPHLDAGSTMEFDAVHVFGYAPGAGGDDPACAPMPAADPIQRFPGAGVGFSGEHFDLLLVQADAPPGMVGGAAVDGEGRLIGVVAGVVPAAGGGVVKVVPIERAREALREILPPETPTPAPTATPIPPTAVPTATATPSPTPQPTPTSIPSPTPTPMPTPSPVPTPTPVPPILLHPRETLPDVLPLAHASCFRIEAEGSKSLEEVEQRLATVDASAWLAGWGGQANAYIIFACDNPPAGGVGYLDVDVYRFADAASAREAVDFFALARAGNTGLAFAAPPAIGDYAVALAGTAVNGQDFSVYAHDGSLLVAVIGVSPSGDPAEDVAAVARAILNAEDAARGPGAAMRPLTIPLAEAIGSGVSGEAMRAEIADGRPIDPMETR